MRWAFQLLNFLRIQTEVISNPFYKRRVKFGRDPGEFDGASIDVVGEKKDGLPPTVISLAEKKWDNPSRCGLIESFFNER